MKEATESRKDELPPNEVGADDAKRSFGDLIARAGFGNERIVVTRHGKPIAAIVGLKDLAALQGAA